MKNAEWISVNDRLPEISVRVIVFRGVVEIASMTGSGAWICSDECLVNDVTYWMPLPEFPKQ
jgi:hypothetical protein